jgi:hypothetical protein
MVAGDAGEDDGMRKLSQLGQPCRRTTITLPPEMWNLVNGFRGNRTLSEYIRWLLQEEIQRKALVAEWEKMRK